jgi:hypothetical protein
MFTVYAKEEGGGKQRKISSTEPIYAFNGTNSMLIVSNIIPAGKRPILLSVEVNILRVQQKYVGIGRWDNFLFAL